MTEREEFERHEAAVNQIKFKHPGILKKCFDFAPPLGWLKLVDNALTRIRNVDAEVQVIQVKSKFGGLRIYTENCENLHTVDNIINEATDRAAKTCEKCGETGESRSKNGWVATLCHDCSDD